MRECLRAHRRFTGDLNPTSGKIGWVENAQPGYMPQDPQKEFAEKVDLFTWMSEWTGKADDDMIIRGTLGRLLFSGDEDAGTLIFVSHDRELVGGLATRIIELKPGGTISDFNGTYDEYLRSQGVEV